MILLDTHVLIWLAEDNPALRGLAMARADAALRRDEVAVSAISFWEIAMLGEKKRLELEITPDALRRQVLERGIREIHLDGRMAIAGATLSNFHGDPADRLIVATALSIDAELLTADRLILKWRGPLKRHDARK